MRPRMNNMESGGRIVFAISGTIGSYQVIRLLGRGATSCVYECRHAALGRIVAIKVLHAHLVVDSIAVERFRREGQAAARVDHPNVVKVLDIGEHEGVPYLVMDRVSGDDLKTYLRQRSLMPVADIVECMLGVVAGIAAAHDAGVVHRDLKPSNIRIGYDHLGGLDARVLDFGISKIVDEPVSDLTDSNASLGTTSYMAPEQVRDSKNVDARSDIYALGVILYECATGALPFCGASTYDRMHAALAGEAVPPTRLRSELPAEFEAIILKAIDRLPENRFASARELGQALAAFAYEPLSWRRRLTARALAGAPRSSDPPGDLHSDSSMTVQATAHPPRGRWPRRVLVLATGAAVAALSLAAAIGRARGGHLTLASSLEQGSPRVGPADGATATRVVASPPPPEAVEVRVPEAVTAETSAAPVSSIIGRPPPSSGKDPVAARPSVGLPPAHAARPPTVVAPDPYDHM